VTITEMGGKFYIATMPGHQQRDYLAKHDFDALRIEAQSEVDRRGGRMESFTLAHISVDDGRPSVGFEVTYSQEATK